MKVCFIINKKAGRGKAEKLWPDIREKIKEYDWEVIEFFTKGCGDATILAQEQKHNKIDLIVAVGGDGTLSEIVNGVVNFPCVLGIIPVGTGNDFARSLGVPLRWEKACQILRDGVKKKVDIGIVNGRYFINASGIGFDADVANEMNHNIKYLTGFLAYLLAVLKRLWKFSSSKVMIKMDGKIIQKDIILMAVGNGKCYGGGMFITPTAKLDDGFLEICLIEKTSRRDLILNLPLVIKGKHIAHPKVDIYKAKKIEVYSEQPMLSHADGEIIGTTPIIFEVLPKHITFLAPKIE